MVVNSETMEDWTMGWVNAESLASFDVNVPSTVDKQTNASIFCCTDNPAIQVQIDDDDDDNDHIFSSSE